MDAAFSSVRASSMCLIWFFIGWMLDLVSFSRTLAAKRGVVTRTSWPLLFSYATRTISYGSTSPPDTSTAYVLSLFSRLSNFKVKPFPLTLAVSGASTGNESSESESDSDAPSALLSCCSKTPPRPTLLNTEKGASSLHFGKLFFCPQPNFSDHCLMIFRMIIFCYSQSPRTKNVVATPPGSDRRAPPTVHDLFLSFHSQTVTQK